MLDLAAMPRPVEALILGLQTTLKKRGVDYDKEIRDFGQVAASEKRLSGQSFNLRDHIRGLLLSQLSNSRPWKPIAHNLDSINRIFLNYDACALDEADPARLESEIRAIGCGNRAIHNQLRDLPANIGTLRRIERAYGSLDKFVTSGNPDAIARQLSDPGIYKLRQVGYALALEYLRNVGVRAAKPDRHVLRILGPERLAYFTAPPSEAGAVKLVADLSAEANCNATYLDNLLWLFCAEDYGDICGAAPRCGFCALASGCQYPVRSKAV